jgi:hypothetical protein
MMFSRCSGKDGWLPYQGSGHAVYHFYNANKTLLKRVLVKETELRLSQSWQAEYSKHDTLEWAIEVTIRLQKEALVACGLAPTQHSLDQLHRSRHYLRKDKSMQLSIPQLFDRSRQGDLHNGALAPDASVHTMDGSAVQLLAFIRSLQPANTPLPVLILAGSVS